MKKIIVFSFVIISIACMFAWSSNAIRAQEPEQPTNQEIQQAKKEYTLTLDDYRTKERRFIVAREQYRQLQTLASLEEVVKASKEVQLARIDTLISYFKNLTLQVSPLRGADITQKNLQLDKLDGALVSLTQLRQTVELADDRVRLDATSLVYDEQHEIYTNVAYSSLILVRIATIQAANDQLGSLTAQVFDSIKSASPSATILAEKQRGYDELSRTIVQIKEALFEATTRYTEAALQDSFSASTYTNYSQYLQPAFTKLKQGESFIKELAK
jgi:hypothetical protein